MIALPALTLAFLGVTTVALAYTAHLAATTGTGWGPTVLIAALWLVNAASLLVTIAGATS